WCAGPSGYASEANIARRSPGASSGVARSGSLPSAARWLDPPPSDPHTAPARAGGPHPPQTTPLRRATMARDSLTITDNRTGKQYELPIEFNAIRTVDLRQISAVPGDGGLVAYDPGLTNTAPCKSKVTMIDGEQGVLRYRGYAIEELAEKSSY